jgi:hypothetical protein
MLSACTLSDNTASGYQQGRGGGIGNTGTVTLSACTLSDNTASSPYVFGGGFGGAIYNFAFAIVHGAVTMIDCTLSGNTASASNYGTGGGIYNLGTLIVAGSTVSGNTATTADGGGIYNNPLGVVTIRNTILAANAGPSAPDLAGTLTSHGHNLIGVRDGGSGYASTDLLGTSANPLDPSLGPLQDNGGPTETMALLVGSPALDAGDPDLLGSPDQRGVVRTGGVNIGAYQASATAFLLTAPRRVHAGVSFDVAVTAVDPFGQVAVGYTGTVTFSSSDPRRRVVLPADYAFTLEDGGVHRFTDTGRGETTLRTHGRQTIAVADTADPSITGQASVRVRRPRPAPGPVAGHGYLGTAPVLDDVVWFPARPIRHGVGDIEPVWWDWLDGADPLLV